MSPRLSGDKYLHYASAAWALCTVTLLVVNTNLTASVVIGGLFLISMYLYLKSLSRTLRAPGTGRSQAYALGHVALFCATLILEGAVLLSRNFGYYGSAAYNALLLSLVASVLALAALSLLLKWNSTQPR